jgi:hypothetical protein
MDNHLLYCMLCNYRDLYIQDRTRQGSAEKYIDRVLESDIDPWIEYFHHAWATEQEAEQEKHLQEVAKEKLDQRRQKLVKAKLKAKLEAAIAEGKEDRS